MGPTHCRRISSSLYLIMSIIRVEPRASLVIAKKLGYRMLLSDDKRFDPASGKLRAPSAARIYLCLVCSPVSLVLFLIFIHRRKSSEMSIYMCWIRECSQYSRFWSAMGLWVDYSQSTKISDCFVPIPACLHGVTFLLSSHYWISSNGAKYAKGESIPQCTMTERIKNK